MAPSPRRRSSGSAPRRQRRYGSRLRSAFETPTAAISSAATTRARPRTAGSDDVNGTTACQSAIGTTRSSEQRAAVEHEEDGGQDREEAVQLLDGEARPGERPPDRTSGADDDRRREQQVRDDSRRARGVPDRRAHAARAALGEPAAPGGVVDAPSRRRRGTAREGACVEPAGPAGAQDQRRLRGDVGARAASPRRR